MATKLEYFKKAIQLLAPIENKDWYVMMFTVPVLKETTDWIERDVCSLITQLDGLYFIEELDGNKTLTKINDWKRDAPLFIFKEQIEIDSTWISNVKDPMTTTVGRLIVNRLCLESVLHNRVEYINNKMQPSELEAMLIYKTRNDEDLTEGDISTREMITCVDRLNFLMSISTFTNIGATEKAITPPPGIKEYKKKLIEEYGERLKDPVTLVEFENKLATLDKEYLADDPAAKNIFNRKSRTGRAKMFLAYGETLDFENTGDNVVLDALSDGISTDPKELAKFMNDLRYGSFSRGADTALSGYAYKILQRSLSGLKISNTPCNTVKGFKRRMTSRNYKGLIGRYVKQNGWVLISSEEKAKAYIDKEVETRSPMYCTAQGNSVCYACMAESYKNQDSGISNLAANISAVLMVNFLKRMHGTIVEVTDIEMDDFCS